MINEKQKIKDILTKEIKFSDIVKYIKKNKIKTAAAGVLAAVLAGVIFLVQVKPGFWSDAAGQSEDTLALIQNGEINGEINKEENSYTYLPETQREIEDFSRARDPFAGTMELQGVVTGGRGKNIAIIRVGSKSFVAGEGTQIAGNLTVQEVRNSTVILSSPGEKIYLELGGKMKLEKIKPDKKDVKETGDEK
ncbi:hypothetical protein JOC37_000438 [Desulfohalotomaculum tongense]|uniref:hypothetical protein n=1 Tax=Desulforadius tongensis TaxID=1216062 RepID=UPI00195BE213|nr:hypothetical protein [Desulforadius tongensis]MBM7854066.1 hypothetical protein [Desulforadius tongensis]